MEVLSIYYNHFGKEELYWRKKMNAVNKLMRSPLIQSRESVRSISHGIEQATTILNTCKSLKRLAYLMDDIHDISYTRLYRYYRNNIYPAEIIDYDSKFYKANIYSLDALLILRDSFTRPYRKIDP